MKDALVPEVPRYDGQFWLGRESDEPHATGGNTVLRFAVDDQRMQLVAFDPLPIAFVTDRHGADIGVLLGHPIDVEREIVVADTVALDVSLNDEADPDTAIERQVYAFAGRWIFLQTLARSPRIYVDADASLSLVYDPEARCAAATTGLLLDRDEYRNRFRADLHAALSVGSEGWFPGGLTAHRGIHRLDADRYLDLRSWRTSRHWPSEPIPALAPDLAIERFAGNVRAATRAIMKTGPVAASLTGGNESRALLAIWRDFARDIRFFTVEAPGSERDVHLARELARRHGLDHAVLPIVRANAAQRLDYTYRAGHCAGGSNVVTHPSIEPLRTHDLLLGGLGGEIGRAFLWHAADTTETALPPATLVQRLGLPPSGEVVEAVTGWVESLPPDTGLSQLDLAYIELRMSPWGFAQSYSSTVATIIHPMISRENFELMLSLPPDWKKSSQVITRTIELTWPELLELPINAYGDYRDRLHVLKRAWRNPKLIAKKIRKMMN